MDRKCGFKKLGLVGFVAIVGLLSLAFQGRGGETEGDSFLTQEQLTQSADLMKRYQSASKEDEQLAKDFLKLADEATSNKQWGPAFKAYGESALVKPTVAALLGLSISIAEMPRERENCGQMVAAKFRDFAQAIEFFEAAFAFTESLGEVSSSGGKAFNEHQKQLLQSQERIFELQRACRET